MAVVSLGFDIIETIRGEVAAVFRSERLPLGKLALVRNGRKATSRILSGVHVFSEKAYAAAVRFVADAAIEQVDSKAAALGRHVVFFEGAKEILVQEMALTASAPGTALIAPLEKLLAANRATVDQIHSLAEQLRGTNRASRVAAAIERLEHVAFRLDASVSAILEITREGIAHEDVLVQIRSINASLEEKLAHYDDEAEFDPELVALAGAAIERISAKAILAKEPR